VGLIYKNNINWKNTLHLKIEMWNYEELGVFLIAKLIEICVIL
jgi:hypothetical protein